MTHPVGCGEGGKGTIIIIDCIIKNVLQFLMLHIIVYSLRGSLLACKEILKIGL